MPTHLLSLDALLAILHHLENGHMTSHMIEKGRASDQSRSSNNHLDINNSAGIIFTTSDREEVTSSLHHQQSSSSEEKQKLTLSTSLSTTSGFRHSDSLPAMTLTDMKNISRSAEMVGGEGGVLGGGRRGKPASGRQAGVAMCQEGGVVVTGEEDGGLEISLPTSKELLSVRQRKKVSKLSGSLKFNVTGV